ncbi:MAG: hypothetical protein KA978_10490 [Deltaproteobacteria bacterium]|jgi:hypothetical protein|nr:hypothetical protein [Deltaproteobacteria bacterium]
MSDDLPDALRGLLASERTRAEPPSDEVARIREAAAVRILAAAGPDAPAPSDAHRPGRWLPPRGLLVGVVVGAIAGHLATRALQSPRERVVVRVVERAPPAAYATREVTDGGSAATDAREGADAAASSADGGARSPAPWRGGRTEAGARGLDAERALIERCSSALVRGDASGALAAAREHARRFRDGALVEEREALTIQALRSLGRASEADARAEAFLRRWPASLHGRHVRNAQP